MNAREPGRHAESSGKFIIWYIAALAMGFVATWSWGDGFGAGRLLVLAGGVVGLMRGIAQKDRAALATSVAVLSGAAAGLSVRYQVWLPYAPLICAGFASGALAYSQLRQERKGSAHQR